MNHMNERQLELLAKKRLRIKHSFILHRNIYFSICFLLGVLLLVLGYYTGDLIDTFIAWICLVASWGCGVAAHAACTARDLKLTDSTKLNREMELIREKMGILNEPTEKPFTYSHKENEKETEKLPE